MKSKIIVLLVVTAVVTLSFTFASIKKAEVKVIAPTASNTEQAGGLASEDKF
jgi:hypothetical protein